MSAGSRRTKQKAADSLHARDVVDVDEVEHTRLISEPGTIVKIRSGQDGADAVSSLGDRDQEPRVTDLGTVDVSVCVRATSSRERDVGDGRMEEPRRIQRRSTTCEQPRFRGDLMLENDERSSRWGSEP